LPDEEASNSKGNFPLTRAIMNSGASLKRSVMTNLCLPERKFADDQPELMDRPEAEPADLDQALANLEKVNRFFDGYRLVRYVVDRWLKPNTSLSILDLCTGGADIPRYLVRLARSRGVRLRLVALDMHPVTLRIAQQRSSAYPEIQLVQHDALTFSPPRKFDYVLCLLSLHHFSAEDARLLLRRTLALADRGILMGDLRRSDFALGGVYFLTATLMRSRMTKADARLSIQRAFSWTELADLAQSAGWRSFRQKAFSFTRQAIWLEGDALRESAQS
jgi:SAM-dependent methyltransferase